MSAPYIHSSRRKKGWKNSPSVRVGLPFLAFIVAGQYFLTNFLEGRFEEKARQQEWVDAENDLKNRRRPVEGLTDEERKGTNQRAATPTPKPEFSLDAEYEKMMQKVNLNEWENVRVPRPDQIRERTVTMKEKAVDK